MCRRGVGIEGVKVGETIALKEEKEETGELCELLGQRAQLIVADVEVEQCGAAAHQRRQFDQVVVLELENQQAVEDGHVGRQLGELVPAEVELPDVLGVGGKDGTEGAGREAGELVVERLSTLAAEEVSRASLRESAGRELRPRPQ